MADTPDSSLAACKKGVPAIGYGTDAAQYGAKCVLLSTIWNWGPYFVKVVKEVQAGTWKPEAYWAGFEENMLTLSPFHPSVPKEVQNKVLALLEKFKQGQDEVFVGPIYDQKGNLKVKPGEKLTDHDLLTMRWLVKGVQGTIPD